MQLFFAKVLRSATAAEVQEVFSKFGDVLQLDLFVEYPVSFNCCLLHQLSRSC